MEVAQKHIRAPELYGDFWFNADPVSLRAYQGNVILLDFWDYTNAESVWGIRYVTEWWKKYRDLGLIVVGVHTPEFKFGRNPEYVQKAIGEYGIEYPVVMDNDGIIWSAYGCRTWPTRYLIDRDGFLRVEHSDSGGYLQLERSIQAGITEAGFRSGLPDFVEPLRGIDQPGAVCYRPSAQVRLGYIQGLIGNPEGYSPESTVDYVDHGMYLHGRFYANGKWMSEREALRFNGEKGEEGTVALTYKASDLNVILGMDDGTRGEVIIEHDGIPIPMECAGSDVRTHLERSILDVDTPRMHHVARLPEFGEHILKLTTNTPGCSLYAFSFGTSLIPDLVHHN